MFLSPESQALISKYFVTCLSCGLPCTSPTHSVCPACGSTSWGWSNRGFLFPILLFLVGILLGEVIGTLAGLFLGALAHKFLAFGLGILTVVGPIHRVCSRKYGEELDNSAYATLISAAFVPGLMLILPIFPRPTDFHYFRYFGIAWTFLGFDSYLFSQRKSPSLNRVIHAIETKKLKLERNLVRVHDELVRLEIGRKTQVILKIIDRLKRGHEIIKNEIPQLEGDRAYTVMLRMFFLWRNCLFSVYSRIHHIAIADLEEFEEINKGLRMEILEVRQYLKDSVASGRQGAIELSDFIEQTLPIHEFIRDIIQARRANQVLSEVDLLKNYDLPQNATPLIIDGLERTNEEILNQVNANYYKIKADSEANELLRS